MKKEFALEDLATPPSYAKTMQAVTGRVLAESRRTYGSLVDDMTIQEWVSVAVGGLLTEKTRVTTFVPLLALRDIRSFAEGYAGR